MTQLTTKYRPRRIGEIFGQLHIKRALSKILKTYAATGEFPACIIAHGAWGLGKTTVARILSMYVNCEKGPLQACLECESCRAHLAGNHPDCWEVDAASYSSVDDIPMFKEWSQYKVRGRKKFLILDEANRLHPKAWDAMLKVIEDNQQNVCWFFSTTETSKLPSTILSRCNAELKFYALSPQDLSELARSVAASEGITFESDEALANIVRKADGHARDVLRFLAMAQFYSNQNDNRITNEAVYTMLEMKDIERARRCLKAAFAKDLDGIFNIIDEAFTVPEEFCHTMIELLRHELYLRSMLVKETEFQAVSLPDLIRFSAMVEDCTYRLGFGESLTSLYIGFERWLAGSYIEIAYQE